MKLDHKTPLKQFLAQHKITKLHQVLQLIYDGLKNTEGVEKHQVEMAYFNIKRDDICFGCAACYALNELGYDPFEREFVSTDTVSEFEFMIDYLRDGYISLGLIEAIHISKAEQDAYLSAGVYISNLNWVEEIERLPVLIKELKRILDLAGP